MHVCAGTANQNAKKALGARLYEKGGGLKSMLEQIANGNSPGTVSLLTDSTQHFYGTAVINYYGQVAVYVIPELRGKGWGSKLVGIVKACTTLPQEIIHSLPGTNTVKSVIFWKRNGIKCQALCGGVGMTEEEAHALNNHGKTLICRKAIDVKLTTIEALYIAQVYTNDYSDEHDSIRGHLACMLNENYTPVEYILYHVTGGFASCATVRERAHDVDDDTTQIVEVQLFVHEDYRKQGLGQEIIDKVKSLYPGQSLFGYHTPTAGRLLQRNGILDLWRVP